MIIVNTKQAAPRGAARFVFTLSWPDALKIEYSFYNKKYKDAGSELVDTRYDKEFSDSLDQLKEDLKVMAIQHKNIFGV